MNNQIQDNPKSNMTALIVGIIVIVIGIVAYAFTRQSPTTPSSQDTGAIDTMATTPEESMTPEVSLSPEPSEPTMPTKGTSVRTFTVTGQNYSFTPSEIKVKKGDTVKIVFKNTGGFHDLVLDEFNVRTPRIQDGGTATVQFLANKTGTFEYYCSVGNHRAMGMKGNLIVQ